MGCSRERGHVPEGERPGSVGDLLVVGYACSRSVFGWVSGSARLGLASAVPFEVWTRARGPRRRRPRLAVGWVRAPTWPSDGRSKPAPGFATTRVLGKSGRASAVRPCRCATSDAAGRSRLKPPACCRGVPRAGSGVRAQAAKPSPRRSARTRRDAGTRAGGLGTRVVWGFRGGGGPRRGEGSTPLPR